MARTIASPDVPVAWRKPRARVHHTVNTEPVTPDDAPRMQQLLLRLLGALTVLFALVVVLGITVAEPIGHLADQFIARFGESGLFGLIFLLDAVPFTTHEPVLFLAYTGGIPFWRVCLLAGTASMLSGGLGWSIGRGLAHWAPLRDLFERYRVAPFLRKYGATAVALAALTPFPYAIVTWGAGASGVRLDQVMVGALFRYPKVVFYLGIIVFGWTAAT